MKTDQSLFSRYRDLRAHAGLSEEKRDELHKAADAYEVACVLSRGPDPDRCAHWQQRAVAAERRFKARLNLAEQATAR